MIRPFLGKGRPPETTGIVGDKDERANPLDKARDHTLS
jgi:hypothetical protein